MRKHFSAIILLLAAIALVAVAHADTGQGQSETTIYHKVGHRWYYPEFRRNNERYQAFLQRLKQLDENPATTIRSITVSGSASPEGNIAAQYSLARNRALVAIDLIKNDYPARAAVVELDSSFVDWDGLRHMLRSSQKPYRDAVLDILGPDGTYAGAPMATLQQLKSRLLSLQGSAPWNDMLRDFFPDLRYARMVVHYDSIIPAPVPVEESKVIPVDQVIDLPEDEKPAVQPVVPDTVASAQAESKPFYMAVRTNMLYDAALVPNLGVELALPHHWSVGANWMYAWWKTDTHHRYWRTYGGDIYVRRYLGSPAEQKPLQGHHLGLYAQMLTYDVELGGRGYLGPRWSYGGGLEYGFSLPVARRLNIDFSVGLGYLGGKYMEYLPIDGHYVWQATKQRHWFGPTKLEVSLQWLIGAGNVNEKKGDNR